MSNFSIGNIYVVRTSDWIYQVFTIYLDGHVRSKVLLQPPMQCSLECSNSAEKPKAYTLCLRAARKS